MAWNYLSYTLQIHDYLMELKRLMQPYMESQQISAWIAEIDRLNEKLEHMSFQVAVVGEFKRGKSSFINALLRKQILPADVIPATATINRITYGNEPASYISWKDGRPEEKIEIEQLADYITKLTDSSAMQAKNIKEAVVRYPCRFCENNVDLIDTPGMNDDDAMNNVTIRELSNIDLAIVTLDPNAPVSNTEVHFIAQLVESDQICQIVFVASKMDTVPAMYRERLLKLIRERLQKHVRQVLLETHDENDPVMEKYAEIFTEPVIFPVSNTQALYAYEMGDQQALEESGFQRLNEELLPLIIRTQHSAAVMTPLNTIVRISGEFIQLLQQWERQTVEVAGLQILKKNFAETAYGFQLDHGKIWSGCVEMFNRKGKERSDAVSAELIAAVRQQKDILVRKVRELFQDLQEKLTLEEQNSYQQIWNKYLVPEYVNLRKKLGEIIQPYPELLQQVEPEWKELVACTAQAGLPAALEPFYWEIPPIPPNETPPGQIAYWIDNAVRSSFAGYYRRRQSHLAEFLRIVMEEQEKKTEALVQEIFQFAKASAPSAAYIQVERETLARLSGKLAQLIRRCSATRENYRKESKNDK